MESLYITKHCLISKPDPLPTVSTFMKLARTWLIAAALTGFACDLTAADLQVRTWNVGGVTREALVSIPAGNPPAAGWPVVFAFHGHGGNMRQASRSFPIHDAWPDAIVIYPQGLPTPSPMIDKDGRWPGWQNAAGEQEDRDLRFFDAMLASLRADYRIDNNRIYATGHSNGGVFTYLLWAERGDVFAAFAPSAALQIRGFLKMQPKPALHLASPNDPLVKYAWQSRMIDYLLRVDHCGPRKPDESGYVSYPSSNGNDVAVYLHGYGHRFPPEGADVIVRFFKAHSRS